MAKLSPVFNDTQFDDDGNLLVGGLIYTYAANSSTPLATYTDESGATPQANPIVLDARGEAANSIWLTEGNSYKLRLFDALGNFIREFDDIAGVGDSAITLDQWVASGITPTYVSATQFTLPGDQTSAFAVNRRIKATVTAGTVYGYISVAAYTSLTTVTVILDSGSLDSGLSAVQLGLITPDNTGLPQIPDFVKSAMIQDDAILSRMLSARSPPPSLPTLSPSLLRPRPEKTHPPMILFFACSAMPLLRLAITLSARSLPPLRWLFPLDLRLAQPMRSSLSSTFSL